MSEQKMAEVIDTPLAPASFGDSPHVKMMELALTNNAAIEVLERLMLMDQTWQKEQARKQYLTAMAGFSGLIPKIEKTKEVRYTHRDGQGVTAFDHAELGQYNHQISHGLSQHGLSHRWESKVEDGVVWVTCVIAHASGHEERTELPGAPDTSGKKNALQAMASTVSYLKRYTLDMALGLAAADQDNGGQDGKPATITKDQSAELEELFDQSGAEWEKFAIGVQKAFKGEFELKSMSDLPPHSYHRVKKTLTNLVKGQQISGDKDAPKPKSEKPTARVDMADILKKIKAAKTEKALGLLEPFIEQLENSDQKQLTTAAINSRRKTLETEK